MRDELMTKEFEFANRVLGVINGSYMDESTWKDVRKWTMGPVVERIRRRMTITINGKQYDTADLYVNLNSRMSDEEINKLTGEQALDLMQSYYVQKQLYDDIESVKPDIPTVESVAKKLTMGDLKFDIGKKFLVFADDLVDLCTESLADFLRTGDENIIYQSLKTAQNIYEHVVLCASYDFAANIEDCRNVAKWCAASMEKISEMKKMTLSDIENGKLDELKGEKESEKDNAGSNPDATFVEEPPSVGEAFEEIAESATPASEPEQIPGTPPADEGTALIGGDSVSENVSVDENSSEEKTETDSEKVEEEAAISNEDADGFQIDYGNPPNRYSMQ